MLDVMLYMRAGRDVSDALDGTYELVNRANRWRSGWSTPEHDHVWSMEMRHGARTIGTIEVDNRVGQSNAVESGELPREEDWCGNRRYKVCFHDVPDMVGEG